MAKLKRFVPLPWPPPDPATEVEFKAVKDIHILGTLRGVVAIAGRQTQNRRTYSREVLYKMVWWMLKTTSWTGSTSCSILCTPSRNEG
jgi:hypothetical protein